MKLSVATNFDDELIDQIKDYPVEEIYGKLPKDFIGGGRSSYMLAPMSKRLLAQHVKQARKHGIGFNYLLNASCMDNMEITRAGQKRIRKLLDWISEIGVSAVTVSNLFLLQTIKKCYPHLRVRTSVFACIDNLRKAKYWEEAGADIIVPDAHAVNRDFETLKFLKDNLACDLEILANGNCLMNCVMAHTHPNLMAHSSQTKHRSGGFVIDHCFLYCQKYKTKDPVNYLRSDWIRPEDIHHYENIGLEHFKLVERNIPTRELVKRVKAYSERAYDGNLLDLIQGFGFKTETKRKAHHLFFNLSFFFRPSKVNPLRLLNLKELCEKKGMLMPSEGEPPVYIDNRKLDDFIKPFLKRSCRNLRCGRDCRHCHAYAEKAITIDPRFAEECLGLHEKIDEEMLTGKMWNFIG